MNQIFPGTINLDKNLYEDSYIGSGQQSCMLYYYIQNRSPYFNNTYSCFNSLVCLYSKGAQSFFAYLKSRSVLFHDIDISICGYSIG